MVVNTSPSNKIDVYQIVTDKIIALLEKGTIPWKQPWASPGMPANLISKRKYRGINLWLLLSLPYAKHLYLTFEQVKSLGGSVKKSEKGHVVIFWKVQKKETKADEEKQSSSTLLRYYKVFNVEQCTGLPEGMVPEILMADNDPITLCDRIIGGMPNCPPIQYNEPLAFYNVDEDYINLPGMNTFLSEEHFYATCFHELIHCTGHVSRLNRKNITEMHEFGSEAYSIEELVAELGSCFLLNTAGILPAVIENSAAYINGWLEKLKNDKRFIVQASSYAQRAVDYILDQLPAAELKEEVEMQIE